MSTRKEWSKEEEWKLAKIFRSGTEFYEISELMGRSEHSCRRKATRMGLSRTEDSEGAAYSRGRQARFGGAAKIPPFEAGFAKWRWLAGWHDADMELGISYIDQLREGKACNS